MEFVSDIGQVLVLAAETAEGEEEGGSFLVSPGLGLMIWTLLLFGFTVFFLSRTVFPKIQEALDSAIMMCHDECISYPAEWKDAERALERTARWAARQKLVNMVAGHIKRAMAIDLALGLPEIVPYADIEKRMQPGGGQRVAVSTGRVSLTVWITK